MTFYKFLAGLIILAITSTTSFAFIVSAPAVEAQLAHLNTMTTSNNVQTNMKWMDQLTRMTTLIKTSVQQVDEIRNQIQQGQQQFDFWKQHAGNWQAIAAKIRTEASDSAIQSGTFCSTDLGMGATDLLDKNSTASHLATAVTETKQLLAGVNKNMKPQDLRNALTQIIGRIPESNSAGVSTFAQTSIEDDIAFIAKTNKAIEQLQAEQKRIKDEREGKIGGGLFTEADERQFQMASADIEAQKQSLQLQALLRIGQQMIVANSFRVKQQNDTANGQNREAALNNAARTLLGGN